MDDRGVALAGDRLGERVAAARDIFLLASERSATNLLRAMWGAHPRIAAPTPPHLLMNCLPHCFAYGDLRSDENFLRLRRRVETLVNRQLGSWRVRFRAEDLLRAAPERTFMAVFDTVYHEEMRARGAARVFFKENESYRYAFLLLRHYPDARFVYLVRDGRDFAVSYLHSPNHFGGLRHAAELWRDEQRQCLAVWAELAPEGRVHVVHYEDLVTFPEQTLRGLCEFVEEEFDPRMLEYFRDRETVAAARAVRNWRNLARPVSAGSVGQYRRRLGGRGVRLFEAIAFRELVQLGYRLERPVAVARRAGRRREQIRLGLRFLANAVRGRLMSRAELRRRRERLRHLARAQEELDLHLRPLVRCRYVDEVLAPSRARGARG